MILARVDYLGRLTLDAAEDAPPGTIAAVVTADGFLRATGYLARDGLLTYSDGVKSWTEYRPREELQAAVDSFRASTVTDGHPAAMLDATSWREHARGVVLDSLELAEDAGVTYLRATLEIRDAELVRRVQAGEAAELSIGFWSDVLPLADGVADDGTRADAVQTALRGNHVAVVERGRAGPACRVVLDGAPIPIASPFAALSQGHVEPPKMPDPNNDAVGGATETTTVQLASGAEVEAPTELVAELLDLRAKVAQMQAPAPSTPPMPSMAPDAMQTPVPTLPAPPPLPSEDAAESLRGRMRLERAAARLKIPDAKIDAASDDELRAIVEDHQREFVATRLPFAKDAAASARGDALATLVSAALAAPNVDVTPSPTRLEPRADGLTDEQLERIASKMHLD